MLRRSPVLNLPSASGSGSRLPSARAAAVVSSRVWVSVSLDMGEILVRMDVVGTQAGAQFGLKTEPETICWMVASGIIGQVAIRLAMALLIRPASPVLEPSSAR